MSPGFAVLFFLFFFVRLPVLFTCGIQREFAAPFLKKRVFCNLVIEILFNHIGIEKQRF